MLAPAVGCYDPGPMRRSTRMASVPKRSHAHDQVADARTLSAGIATRPCAKSVGPCIAWALHERLW